MLGRYERGEDVIPVDLVDVCAMHVVGHLRGVSISCIKDL